MAVTTSTLGRPRQFDEDEVLDRVVDLFWSGGVARTTTRVLEAELGLKQSSIYNAFGSKNALLLRALDRYLERLDESLVASLDDPTAGLDQLIVFLVGVQEWVTTVDHPGCLLFNTLGQSGSDDLAVVARATTYRARVRSVLTQLFANMEIAEPGARAELVLATMMGFSLSAHGGADAAELDALGSALWMQITEWLPD